MIETTEETLEEHQPPRKKLKAVRKNVVGGREPGRSSASSVQTLSVFAQKPVVSLALLCFAVIR